ncbi:hypothetical protein ACF1BQ_018660 [Bradyrhizobium sp. RDT10]
MNGNGVAGSYRCGNGFRQVRREVHQAAAREHDTVKVAVGIDDEALDLAGLSGQRGGVDVVHVVLQQSMDIEARDEMVVLASCRSWQCQAAGVARPSSSEPAKDQWPRRR